MCGFVGYTAAQSTDVTAAFEQGLAEVEPRGTSSRRLQTPTDLYGYCRLPTDGVQNTALANVEPLKNTYLLFNGLITNVAYLVETYHLTEAALASDCICMHEGLLAYGVDFLRHCRGMFAVAFVTDTSVLLARDTVGVKPLYYVDRPACFGFASELKALQHWQVPIQEVLPGSIVVFNKDTRHIETKPYAYEPYEGYRPADLMACLKQSVVVPSERYLRQAPNKKIALLLSGGLDSSIIAQLLVNHLEPALLKQIEAFCIGEDDSSDVLAAQQLAKRLGLQLVHLRPYAPEAAFKALPNIVYDVESPYARVIKVALLYEAIAKELQSREIQVVVSGEGADELFYGYHRFIDGLKHDQLEELFDLFYEGVFYYTLLQRYDRVFARHQVEGRVPFLDQEVIALAKKFRPHQKVQYNTTEHVSKLPLRAIAKEIGLPRYIYDRRKEKMTAGATGKENTTASQGYLEAESRRITGRPFAGVVDSLYQARYFANGNDLWRRPATFITEEDIMKKAQSYRTINLET